MRAPQDDDDRMVLIDEWSVAVYAGRDLPQREVALLRQRVSRELADSARKLLRDSPAAVTVRVQQ